MKKIIIISLLTVGIFTLGYFVGKGCDKGRIGNKCAYSKSIDCKSDKSECKLNKTRCGKDCVKPCCENKEKQCSKKKQCGKDCVKPCCENKEKQCSKKKQCSKDCVKPCCKSKNDKTQYNTISKEENSKEEVTPAVTQE